MFAPGGVRHLLHEVLAHVADEAAATGQVRARCEVTVPADGSVRVRDHGRGTDTRRGEDCSVVRKPVMATRDLRFFDAVDGPLLPDGHPRRGMSVVCALSAWLVHENRRLDGAWSQRYEHGVPVDELVELPPDGTTGTLVQFLPRADLAGLDGDAAAFATAWPTLDLRWRRG